MYYSIQIGGTLTTGQAVAVDDAIFKLDPNCYDSDGWTYDDGVVDNNGAAVMLNCDDGSRIDLDRFAEALAKLPVVFKITMDPEDECGGGIIVKPDPASAEIRRGSFDGDGPSSSLADLKEALAAGRTLADEIARLESFDIEVPPFVFDDADDEEDSDAA
jgi:hypothetical protein